MQRLRARTARRFILISLTMAHRIKVSLTAEDFLDDLLVLLLVAFFESNLRVSNDANCVDDEGRSPKRIRFTERGLVALKNGISHFEFLGQLARLLQLRMHGDHEDLEALVGISIMKLLEMNHLLTRERSVS